MLIRNAIRTPDGTILESRSVHDYRTHMDTVTNRQYMIDGVFTTRVEVRGGMSKTFA
jgi:hypothetical protein